MGRAAGPGRRVSLTAGARSRDAPQMGQGQLELAHLQHLGVGFGAARGPDGDGLRPVACIASRLP